MTELPLPLRLAWRSILRRPSQPIVAILTLGLAVGAVGLMLAAVYDVVLRPLPYRAPERVMVIRGGTDLLTPAAVQSLRSGATAFVSTSAYSEERPAFRDGERTRRVSALAVDSQFVSLLGVRPSIGRAFVDADFAHAAAPAAIVSHAFAQRWHDTRRAVGERIILEGFTYTVVGVMPSGFEYPRGTEIWVPGHAGGDPQREHLWVLARLKDGVTSSRAATELALLASRVTRDRVSIPKNRAYHAEPFLAAARGGVTDSFWMLVCSIALLFLLTAGTLANLFLVRALSRTHEMAVHAALGGTGMQLVRQQITESALVSGAGTLLGGTIVWLGSALLPRLTVNQDWWPSELTIDWRVLLIVSVVAISVAVVLGMVPLLQFRRTELGSALRNGASGVTPTARQRRWRSGLVGAEISLVMFLVIAAGVLAKRYRSLDETDWGYDARHLVFGAVMLPQPRFASAAERQDVAHSVAARLRAIPGATHTAVFGESFPAWIASTKTISQIDGYSGTRRHGPAEVMLTIDTDSAFFSTMGTRIIRGRGLLDSDRAGSMPVAVIDERLAAENWPGQEAIGHHIRFPGMEPGGPWYTIVGVASNAAGISTISALAARGTIAPISVMYRSRAQVTPTWPDGTGSSSTPGFAFAIHTPGDPRELFGAVRRALAESAPDQPVEHLGTVQDYLNADGVASRGATAVLAGFGGFGVLLCLIGVVGVVSETVTRRTREIGVRMALGAQWRDVAALVLHEASLVACTGVVIGLFVSAILARTVGHFVFARGVGIDDPVVLFVSAASVLLIVLAASLWPAARALRVDPVIALRSE